MISLCVENKEHRVPYFGRPNRKTRASLTTVENLKQRGTDIRFKTLLTVVQKEKRQYIQNRKRERGNRHRRMKIMKKGKAILDKKLVFLLMKVYEIFQTIPQ